MQFYLPLFLQRPQQPTRFLSRILFAGILAMLAWTCTTDNASKEILNIKLDDSLAYSEGKYDAIQIDILTEDGRLHREKVYYGPYHPSSDGKLKGVEAGDLPEVFQIRVIAYKDNDPALVFVIGVDGDTVKKPEVVLRDARPVVVVRPDSLVFHVGDAARRLSARIALDSQQLGVTWHSSRTSIASVDSQGFVTPHARGMALITARAKMDTLGRASVPVTVRDDTPSPLPTAVKMLTASPLILAAGAPPRQAEAQVEPVLASQELIWTSRNPNIASVDEQGRITPLALGEVHIVAKAKEDSTLMDSLAVLVIHPPKVDSLFVTPDSLTLYLGGSKRRLQVRFVPEDTAHRPVFLSSDTGVAKVDAAGLITAAALGDAEIRVTPLGIDTVSAIARIRVKRDAPVLNAGPDRSAKVGDSLTFTLQVTQEYGGIRALRWDLDGDGDTEGSLQDTARKDTVLVLGRKYTEATEIRVGFFVEDTEGNQDSTFVRVIIGSQAPFVDIVKPSRDTTIATRSFTLEYLVDGLGKTRNLQLEEGRNEIIVADTSSESGLVGKDSVVIWVDTEPPEVKITSPDKGFLTRLATIPVEWSVEGTTQETRKTEPLGGKQGNITIVRDAVDSVGNRGQDSVIIRRDTIPPVFQMQSYSSGQTVTLTETNDIDLQGTLADPGSGIKSLGYEITGKTTQAFAAMTPGEAWNLDGIRLNNQGESVIQFTYADSAGNTGSATLRVDVRVPLPTVEFLPPTPPDGWVGVQDEHTIEWRVNGANTFSEDITLEIDETKAIRKTAKNAIGDSVSAEVRISRVAPYVFFVDAAATGRNDGTSWRDAIRICVMR